MNKLLVCFLLVAGCAGSVRAQEVTLSSDSSVVVAEPVIPRPAKVARPKAVKPIKNEVSFGLRLNTNGWGIYSEYGKVRTEDWRKADMFHNVMFLQAEFSEVKDEKEEKVKSETTTSTGGTSSYIYAKINNLYSLKLGAGYRKMIAGKPEPGCVSLHWVTAGGFALGIVKPYYIQLSGQATDVKYTDLTQSDFLNERRITGNSGFSKGLDEAVMAPGGYIRTALHMDFSSNNNNVIGVEVGVNAEFYSQQVQLMVGRPASSGFYNLFVAVQFGKRW